MRLRLSDLEQTVTLGEVWDKLDTGALIQLVRAGIEHWTDDEGLHVTPFEEDLRDDLQHWWDTEVIWKLVD